MQQRGRSRANQDDFMMSTLYRIFKEIQFAKINQLQISRKSQVGYIHTLHIMKLFEKKGLVVKKRKGKSMVISLTEKGQRIATLVMELRQTFSEGGTNDKDNNYNLL